MNYQVGFWALTSAVSLVGIFYLVFWRYRQFRIDLFRQQMFELRDEFFDAAADGLINFSHPAYGTLRSTMNGFIRYGHRLNLLHILCLGFLVRADDMEQYPSFEAAWLRATKKLDEATKERLDYFRSRMELLMDTAPCHRP